MIVTFYSFKGGVGRSMAMANLGEILADRGYHVILCDWDLEAPGLERYLVPGPEEMPAFLARQGLMDLLLEYKEALTRPPADPELVEANDDTHAQVGRLRLRRPSSLAFPVSTGRPRSGSLRLLSAGQRHGEAYQRYGEAVRRFDWDDFYSQWAGDAYIDFFRRDLAGDPRQSVTGAADLVLIDSRTGVTEQGGVCTHDLADLVVLLSASNDLNIEGTRWMVQALTDPRLVAIRGDRPLAVLPVASRIEQTSQLRELVEFRARFLDQFREPLQKVAGNAERFALDSEIPYMPFYSFQERIVAREPEEKREKKLYSAYQTLAETLIRYGVGAGLLREPASHGRVVGSAKPPSPRSEVASWDEGAFLRELRIAVESLDHEAAARVCGRLTEHLEISEEPMPEESILTVLRTLRRKCFFDLLQQVAAAAKLAGLRTPAIQRQNAEALLELGQTSSALTEAEALLSEVRDDPAEQAQTQTLIGRVYERLYVEATDPASKRSQRNLERAVNAYFEAYTANQQGYANAGVSAVALLLRAERNDLRIEGFPEASGLADHILAMYGALGRRRGIPARDLATAAEACLAVGLDSDAVALVLRYIDDSSTDAYECAVLLRRLTGIWQLDPAIEPGASLLPVLRARLLALATDRIEIDPRELSAAEAGAGTLLAEVPDDDQKARLALYWTALARCRRVARIESSSGEASGTGFLVRGSDLDPSLGSEPLLLTTAAVVSFEPKSALPLEEARVRFPGQDGEAHRLTEIVWSSPAGELDVTLARLEPRIPEAEPWPLATEPPAVGSRLYLAGYPGARSLAVSAGALLDQEDSWLHYRADTGSGSAGSPVFDQEWRLVALHQASLQHVRRVQGQPSTSEAREGLWIQALVAQVRSRLAAKPTATPAMEAVPLSEIVPRVESA